MIDKASEPFIENGILLQLLNATNEAARSARATLTTLLVVTVYLGSVLLGTTHDDLFTGGGVVIPQIGLRVPILSSYVLAPIVFLYLHLSLLVQISLLDRKLDLYQEMALREGVEDAGVFIFPFAYAYRDANSHVTKWMIKTLTTFALTVAPVLLLSMTTFVFLPYQDWGISMLHKLIVLLDVVAIGWFVFRVQESDLSVKNLPGLLVRNSPLVFLLVLCVCIFVYANPPSRMTDRIHLNFSLSESEGGVGDILQQAGSASNAHSPLRDLHDGQGDRNSEGLTAARLGDPFNQFHNKEDLDLADTGDKPIRLWRDDCSFFNCNILDWICENSGTKHFCRYLIPETRIQIIERPERPLDESDETRRSLARATEGLSLRNRTLRFAVLDGRVLDSVDLRGADLYGASMRHVEANAARLDGADLRNAMLNDGHFSGASFRGAHLTYARLVRADIRKADFLGADLRAVRMRRSNGEGATFRHARLSGVHAAQSNFRNSDFVAAVGHHARFDGVDASYSDFRNAWFIGAHFWSTNLNGTSFQGAVFPGVQFGNGNAYTADFSFTDLRHAVFTNARIDFAAFQHADLSTAQLNVLSAEGSDFKGARLPNGSLKRGFSGWELHLMKQQVRNRYISHEVANRAELATGNTAALTALLPKQESRSAAIGIDRANNEHVESLVSALLSTACKSSSAAQNIALRIINLAGVESGRRLVAAIDEVYGIAAEALNAELGKPETCIAVNELDAEYQEILGSIAMIRKNDPTAWNSDYDWAGDRSRVMPPLGREPDRGHASSCLIEYNVQQLLETYKSVKGDVSKLLDPDMRIHDLLDEIESNSGQDNAIKLIAKSQFIPLNRARCVLVCVSLVETGPFVFYGSGTGSHVQDPGIGFGSWSTWHYRSATESAPALASHQLELDGQTVHCARHRGWRQNYISYPGISIKY